MPPIVPQQKNESNIDPSPLILAPAGSRAAFMAAIAAGADAIYCGLKLFSARMEAKNFSIEELARLTRLAHRKEIRVFVTLNSLVKPGELNAAAEMVSDLAHKVRPDALIVQDLAFLELARQMGYKGQLHLSTLANVSFPAALAWIKERFDVTRVVVPRELSIDEIKTMAAACPTDLGLETFIHGALCYGVSGRCYWSSWFGGKSGLRGRCVQPCRRLYQHRNGRQRYFSCQDLSIDVLVKALKGVEAVKVWKIEGRKKGPHYVFYTVNAYRLLRDHHHEAARKRDALALLEQSLGRPNTHYNFLPQRPQSPIDPDSQTGSGLMLGRVQGSSRKPFVISRIALLPGDVLRTGYEDEDRHSIQRLRRHVPKKGRLYLKVSSGKSTLKGAPVFLTDRREDALDKMIEGLEKELDLTVASGGALPRAKVMKLPSRRKPKENSVEVEVSRHLRLKRSQRGDKREKGVWLSDSAVTLCSKSDGRRTWWWLPPVIWPTDQEKVSAALEQALALGSRRFVLNSPWQMALFPVSRGLNLWAGPFCNAANPLALQSLKTAGFSGVIVSPELGRNDYELLARNTPLPLGIVLSGHWPLCISRTAAGDIAMAQPFASPRGETAWIQSTEYNYWVYPNWCLDLTEKKAWLERAGYRLFVHLIEPVPPKVNLKKRPGFWNWELGLR